MRPGDLSNVGVITACNHTGEAVCKCQCHERYTGTIIHDHACCEKCLNCGVRIKCKCKRCTPALEFKPLKEPTATSTKVTMEMIVGSVEVDEVGNRKINRFVSFTTGDGHHIVYPWEALKQTVKQWIEIEENGN